MAGLIDTSSRNLKAELVRHRKTRGDLAKAWGCALNTVDKLLDGSIPLTIKEIEQAAPVLDMDSTQLIMLLIQPLDGIKQIKAVSRKVGGCGERPEHH